MSRLARLPVRVRVTLAFAGVMALVLGATGLFVYARLGAELDHTIEQGLRSRAGDVSALVQQADSGLAESGRSPLTEQGENLAQILDASGAVLDSTPTVREHALLDAAALARAQRGTIVVDRGPPPGAEDPVRLLATPVSAHGQALVAVVGTPVDDRDDALRNLAGTLLIGGPIALLLASLAGYGAAAAALRPVERMRRRAAEIQAAEPGTRLPVGPADDEIGRLGETLNLMLARLEAAFARERTFVADASHELRTPLAILKAELELALRAGRSVEELEAALRSAAEETDRLVQLAEDLLVIARVEEGRLPIRSARLDAQDVVEAVEQRFAPRIALDVRAPEGLGLGSRSAAAAAGARQPRRQRAAARRCARGAERRARERPGRAARSRRRAGLPRAVHRRRVRALHARGPRARPRWSGSRARDRGRDRRSPRRGGRRAQSPRRRGRRVDLGAVRVLIVEDEVKMAALIRRGLRDDGMAADVAIKGEDALWMAAATDYDVIVLDVMLPGIDGFEVCRRLRADAVWAPVLMLTARDAIDDRVRGSTPAPTTTWSSRSRSPSWRRGCGRCRGAGRSSARPC